MSHVRVFDPFGYLVGMPVDRIAVAITLAEQWRSNFSAYAGGLEIRVGTPDPNNPTLPHVEDLSSSTTMVFGSRPYPLVIVGDGPDGRMTVSLPASAGVPRISIPAGSGIEFRRLDLVMETGSSSGGPETCVRVGNAATFVVTDCSVTRTDQADAVAVATVPGCTGTQVILHGLRVFGGTGLWGVGVRLRSAATGLGVECELVDCGFQGCSFGVVAVGIWVLRSVGVRCDSCMFGFRLFLGGRDPRECWVEWVGGQFTDCLFGTSLWSSWTGASSGPPAPVPTSPALRGVTLLSNEFRAPGLRRFPQPPNLTTQVQGSVLHRNRRPARLLGETTGISIGWRPALVPLYDAERELRVINNVIHLLDTGIDIQPVTAGRVHIGHNTFVANAVRSLLLRGPRASWGGLPAKVWILCNLFRGRQNHDDLGLAEGQWSSLVGLAPRYCFGAIQLGGERPNASWPIDSPLGAPVNYPVVLGRNHTRGFSGPTPWDAFETLDIYTVSPTGSLIMRLQPSGHRHTGTPLENRPVQDALSGTPTCGVLRLPRVRMPAAGQPFVSWDYHPLEGGAEEGDGVVPGLAWLLIFAGAVTWVPTADFFGRARRVGPTTVGALESEPAWKQFPLILRGHPDQRPDLLPLPDYADVAAFAAPLLTPPLPGTLGDVGNPADPPDAPSAQTARVLGTFGYGDPGYLRDLLDAYPDLHFVYPVAFEASSDYGISLSVDGMEIPLRTAAVGAAESYSEEFITWWEARASFFIRWTRQLTGGGRIYCWYGAPEEFLSGMPTDRGPWCSAMLSRLREIVRRDDPFLGAVVSYVPSWRPHVELIEYSLLGFGGGERNAYSGNLDPSSPVPSAAEQWIAPPPDARVWDGSQTQVPWTCGVPSGDLGGDADSHPWDDYASGFLFSRDSAGAIKILQDHLYPTCYIPYAFRGRFPEPTTASAWTAGDRPWNTNRSMSFHFSLTNREGNDNVLTVLDTNLDRLPGGRKVFHSVGVFPADDFKLGARADPAAMEAVLSVVTIPQARMDLLAGLHALDGVFIEGWGSYRVQGADGNTVQPAALAYAEVLALIKGGEPGLREALANGEVLRGWNTEESQLANDSAPWLSITTGAGDAAGLDLGAIGALGADPDPTTPGNPGIPRLGVVRARPAIVWTAFRLGNTVWVLVTCALKSPNNGFNLDLTIATGTTPSSVANLTGLESTLIGDLALPASLDPKVLSFAGIDGAILRIVLGP